MTKTSITIAHGDGIGPEIMEAVLSILDAAGAPLAYETIEIGKAVYERGVSSGIEPSAWESLRRTQVFLKAPITTPQGGGFKSLNVTVRKTLGLFANVRPVVTYAPFVRSRFPGMDVVIVRENEEDLYAGIEHRQTPEVYQCLKLLSRPGTEKVVRYAFEYAVKNARNHVTCMSKDNIMKLTDGLFHRVFDEVAKEYPSIGTNHMIIDIGAARLANDPFSFDVIVTPNLYGDIISDIVAEVGGSVGLAGSANIGDLCAMFEAIHGSAPDIAGQGVANPSGLLYSAVMMLVHVGHADIAEIIQNAWLKTIEEGIHTKDIYVEGKSRQNVGTRNFARAVIDRLGQRPEKLAAVVFDKSSPGIRIAPSVLERPAKQTVGVDVFIDWDAENRDPEALAVRLQRSATDRLALKMVTNRGVKVWPEGISETFCTDHWRCRYVSTDEKPIQHADILDLLQRVAIEGLDFIKTEHLCTFDGRIGYSLGQGE
ncbi:MAG: NADP-dependent isocitrate dehydrogenase [Myxococcales bacterium]|nr:NADP-dependent isocitrate dehydrogenase [Myxococcales bacterium]